MKLHYFFACIMLLGWWSCSKDQSETDRRIIEEFIAKKGWTAQSTDEGLYYVIENEGTGARPTLSNKVTVHYTGYFTDETIFDSTNGKPPANFPLNGVIRGWQIGIPLFKEGGKGKLLIPSELGYGSNPPFGIPANAVLIFDVELIKVQ